MDNNFNSDFSRTLRLTLIITIITFSLSQKQLFSQKRKEEPPPFRERLFFGGNLGLQFGTITDIQLSPVIGLWLLPRLAVAAGPNYRFYKEPSFRTDIYGGRVYTEFVFIRDLNSLIPLGIHLGFLLHAEDELLSLQSSVWKYPPYTSDRFYVNTALCGVGISQPLGRRASMNFLVLWALNDSYYDLYSDPEFRISFNF
jgi:hypothetical protein